MSSGEGTATSSGALVIKSANSGAAGGSGAMTFSSGTSKTGNSGPWHRVWFSHWRHWWQRCGHGGQRHEWGWWPRWLAHAGRSTVHTGGAMFMSSGEGTALVWVPSTIKSANSGAAGGSGAMSFSSGTSKEATQVHSAWGQAQPLVALLAASP